MIANYFSKLATHVPGIFLNPNYLRSCSYITIGTPPKSPLQRSGIYYLNNRCFMYAHTFLKIKLANSIPNSTPNKLSPRFRRIFVEAKRNFPLLNNLTVSKLNVENVLNPPSKPVDRNSLVLGDSPIDCCSSPTIKPIDKPAITLDKSVPSGKLIFKCPTTFVNVNRRHDPKNPPTPTTKSSN